MSSPVTAAISVSLAFRQFCCLNLVEVTCLNDSKGFRIASVDGMIPVLQIELGTSVFVDV